MKLYAIDELTGLISATALLSTINPDYMETDAPLRTHKVTSNTLKETMLKYPNSPEITYAKSQAP